MEQENQNQKCQSSRHREGTNPALVVTNQKGGVGKSTTCLNLLSAYANLSLKVLGIDGDPQGNLSKTLVQGEITKSVLDIFNGEMIEPYPTYHKNISIIPATIKLSTVSETITTDFEKLFKLRDYLAKVKYDLAILDTPPTLTGITLASIIGATHIVMPISPHLYSLQGCNDLLETYRKIKERLNSDLEFLGAIITDFDKRTALGNEIVKEIQAKFKEKVFSNMIPRSVSIEEAIVNGKSIIDTFPASKISKLYIKLADEIILRINGVSNTDRFSTFGAFTKELAR